VIIDYVYSVVIAYFAFSLVVHLSPQQTLYRIGQAVLVGTFDFVFSLFVRLYLLFDFVSLISPPHYVIFPTSKKLSIFFYWYLLAPSIHFPINHFIPYFYMRYRKRIRRQRFNRNKMKIRLYILVYFSFANV